MARPSIAFHLFLRWEEEEEVEVGAVMGRKDVLPWQQAGGKRAPEAAIAAAVWGWVVVWGRLIFCWWI